VPKAVSYHADWRKLTFYAAADRFVASTREFCGVALAPFAILNAGLLLGYALAGPPRHLGVAWGRCAAHGGCAGDFGPGQLPLPAPPPSLVTYDDVGAAKSFFLRAGEKSG
jgi:hypothetical protein